MERPYRTANQVEHVSTIHGPQNAAASQDTQNDLLLGKRRRRRGIPRFRTKRRDLVHVHAVIVVSQQMTKVHHVTPWHFRVTHLEVVRDRVRRFADDLEQSLGGPVPCPVAVK